MTHRKHAATLLTAVLLLALTACGRQTAAASDPAQTPAAPAVETPAIAAPAAHPLRIIRRTVHLSIPCFNRFNTRYIR